MKRTFAFIIMFALLLSSFAFAESFTGKVISVIDGNNLLLASGTKTYRVRLVGVECPEIDQPFGAQAKQLVTDMVRGRDVWVDVKGVDHDNRFMGLVIVEGKDLSLEIINAGLAWCDTKFQRFPQIVAAEKYVKENKVGMWAYSNNERPGLFRQEKRGVVAIMSKNPCCMGRDYSFASKKFGWGIKDASWPAGGWKNPGFGNGPHNSPPGCTSPASSAPGSNAPRGSTPGGSSAGYH